MGAFSVLGVPVRVDPWFFLGLFFVYSWSGGERAGLVAAVALGVLTLIHELGHALTARRFGCRVAISLNLFVGWASYSAPKPLSRRQQIQISLMGPLSQLAVAWAGLAVIHTVFHRSKENVPLLELLLDLWQGLTWAGTIIAFLNLLPLWPLDGGHIVHNLLRAKLSDRTAMRTILYSTLVLMAVIIVLGLGARNGRIDVLAAERGRMGEAVLRLGSDSLLQALWGQIRVLPGNLLNLPWFLLIFTGLSTMQTLGAMKASERDTGWMTQERGRNAAAQRDPAEVQAASAELGGWSSGTLPQMPRRWSASPWLRAHVAYRVGDLGGVQAALAQVAAPGRRWVLPDPSNPAIRPLVGSLPSTLPVGDRVESLVLLDVLGHHSSATAFLDYANVLYAKFEDPEVLIRASIGLTRLGHFDDAMAWLRRGMLERPDAHRLATEPAFAPLHRRMDFQQLLTEVRSTPQPS
jgi:Zn-dependent protease